MSTLSYNGITIALTRTNFIAHEPVRDVDETYLYTRVTIEVAGIVSGAPSQSQNPAEPAPFAGTLGAPVSDTLRATRHALLQPRGALSYSVGDTPTPMIASPPGQSPCDANNGPVPEALTIVRVDGTRAFAVTYRISTCLYECPGSTGTPSALISNRMSQTHTVDSRHYTTITSVGQAFFRTDILENMQQVADDYRSVLLPPVPKGFQRMGVAITATPSRNALTYQVTDVERAFDLGETGPDGDRSYIVDCKANYAVTSTGVRDGGPVSYMSMHKVDVQVYGSKAASPWQMTKYAFNVAATKLPIGVAGGPFIRHVSIMQSLTERFVALTITMQLPPTNNNNLPGIDTSELRQDEPTFSARGGVSPALPTRGGTAGTYSNHLIASAWKSACSDPAVPTEGRYDAEDSAKGPYDSDATGPVFQAETTEDLPPFETQYSPGQSSHSYTDYKIDVMYEYDTMMYQAAIAGKAVSPGNGYVSGGGSSGGPSGGPSSGSTGDPGDDSKPDSTFITLGRPKTRKIVEWSAERVGAAPDVPNSKPVDPNLVLIGKGHVTMAEPSLLADGETLSYRISGRYVHGLKKNNKSTDSIAFPAPPWQSYAYGENVLVPASFLDGIIDSAEPPATGDDGTTGDGGTTGDPGTTT